MWGDKSVFPHVGSAISSSHFTLNVLIEVATVTLTSTELIHQSSSRITVVSDVHRHTC